MKDGRAFNMGYIQSKPIARADGTLTLSYRNGDICHKGTPRQSHRSTRINFFCSTIEVSDFLFSFNEVLKVD